jgi:PAS domain S-box-containing protein
MTRPIALIAVGAGLAGTYLLVDVDAVRAVLVVLVSGGSAAAVAAGIRRHRPRPLAPWVLVGGGQLVWAIAWVVWELPIVFHDRVPSAGSTINLVFLAGNLLVAASLAVILVMRERDALGVVDAAAIAASLGVVAWAGLLHRYTNSPLVSAGGEVVQIAYGLADVLLVALVVRVLVAPIRRSLSLALLLAAPLALVASDGIWNWLTLLGDYNPGTVGDAGWIAFSLFTAAGALHPSMRDVFVLAERRERHFHWGRLAMLAATILVCPATYLVEAAVGTPDASPLVAGGAIIGALVLIRLALVLRAQEAIARRLGELAAIVESTEDAVIATDLDGTITSWNGGAEELYGHRADEVIGRSVLLIVPNERRELVAETMEIARRGGHIDRHDATGVHKNGTSVDVALTVSPIRDDHGRVVGTATIARDISDRVAHQAELAAQNERLRELDRLKDDFVASVSHELRTPLTSIRGYLELVRDDGGLDEEQERMLAIVDRNAARLLRLVSDLLFVAQLDAGTLTLERERVDLAALAGEAIEAARPRADGASVELELDADQVIVDGDRSRLGQVFDNLLSNAIKFTPAGGRVRVSVAPDGRVVRIAVADTGMGIPEEECGRLFERFFRTSSATRAAVPGTGLGLTIVQAIAESHDGRVSVESRVGEGTTFAVELPAGVREPATA